MPLQRVLHCGVLPRRSDLGLVPATVFCGVLLHQYVRRGCRALSADVCVAFCFSVRSDAVVEVCSGEVVASGTGADSDVGV